MPREESLDLTRRALAHIDNDTLDIADDVWCEPREAFVDPARWEADVQMLRSVPHVIGWTGEVATPGSYTTKDVMGVPVLVTRGKDSALRAFINGCAHRGAQVATDCGTTRLFTCPYHGWTYGLDGRLAGVPARKMFTGADLDKRVLKPLPVCEQSGLIIVGPAPGTDVSTALDDIAEPLAAYDFAHDHHVQTRRFEVAANWKLTVDVNFEGYHFPYVHADTLDPIASNNSVIDIYGRNIRWAFPFRDIVQYRDVPTDDWPDQFFPSCVLIEVPASSQMLRIYPGKAPGESIAYLTYGAPSEELTDQEREFYHLSMDAACRVLCDQDFPAVEACQRGLAAGVDHVVFGRNEPLLQHLAAAWQQALHGEHSSTAPHVVGLP